MRQLIGVATPSVLYELKRQLLLVDQIGVIHDATQGNDWDFRSKNPRLAADLDWLEQRGLVFRTDSFLQGESGIDQIEHKDGCVVLKQSSSPGFIRLQRHKPLVTTADHTRARFTVRDLREAINDVGCRWECERLRTLQAADAISLHPPGKKLSRSGSIGAVPGDVHSIIITALPQPDETTSLERIVEFREDPLSKSKLLGLRRWASKLTKLDMSPIEVAQELEWLLHEYEGHIRLQKMKVVKGTIETIVTVAAEIAEDLVKIKWGKLGKLPFLLSHKKIALLESELSAPGREIAYVSHAREWFDPKC